METMFDRDKRRVGKNMLTKPLTRGSKDLCPMENDCECEWRSGAFCTISSFLNREVCRSMAAEIGDRNKKLKPCPACGGEARIYVRQGGASGEFFLPDAEI